MKKHSILLVTISCFFVSLTSETIEDVNIIYHIQPTEGEYYAVDVEVHSRTNSIGKILVRDNGSVVVPEALGSFSPCSISSYSSCVLPINGSWSKSFISYSLLKEVSLRLPNELSCEFNNGNCQLNCQNVMGQPKCSCLEDFTLNNDNRTCEAINSNYSILVGNTGSFKSPNYPHHYPNGVFRCWLIVTPIKTQIKLDIPKLVTESSYDFLKVFDGINITSWSGTYNALSVKSTSNFMRLKFTSDVSNTFSGFSAIYKSEPIITSKTKSLQLNSNAGTLKFQLKSMLMCLSLIYNLPSHGSVEILVEHQSSRFTTFTEIYKKEVNGWTISRHVPEIQINNTDDAPTYLFINWKGTSTKILNIVECSGDDEDVYNFGKFTWTADNFPKLQEQATLEDNRKCSKGGKYHASSNVCICSPGFTGNQCEEACGPNRYGDKCSGVCSWLKRGCKNMIFCNALGTCTCATGYTGRTCNEECSQNYGSNCINNCGQCKDSSVCDKYTGECSAGCTDGYYPPYCQERYVTIKDAPTIRNISWHSASMHFNLGNLEGRGKPHLYVVQYKRKLSEDTDWIQMMPEEIKVSDVVVKLNGLKAGSKYLSKVILISEDGNSYQGLHVHQTEFETHCLVPNSENYQIKINNITSSAFTFEWKYDIMSDKWCEVNSYEIIMTERWRKFYQEIASYESLQATYRNLWAGHQYEVSVCAKTHQGIAQCSSPLKITTLDEAPGKVKYLKVNSTSARNIHLSWKKPLFTGGLIKGYRIQYQCLQFYICNETCEHSKGTIETSQTSSRIAGLLPYAQYKIRVAAYSTNQGPFTNVFAMTHSTKPETAPTASEEPLISKSNTSATFQWKPPNCFGLNGNFKEYFYTWSSTTDNTHNVSFTGTTKDTKATITDLKAKTDYLIHVHVVNTHGWNPDYKLVIPFSTSATVPDVVTDLEVYKSGRRMIGIRWGKPTKIYGVLKSFTVSYCQKDDDQQFNKTISPTPCLSWPNFYCHTINANIKPDKYYVIGVKARNNEINEDGNEANIIAQSRESAPEAPSYLQIVKSNSTSFSMEWGIPNKFNGELRSFLVNVEHIEALNDDDCCEYFPVQELPYREESKSYSLQVDGLVPSSTYIISVSAKTILLGPSVNDTFNTSPLPQSSLIAPRVTPLKGKGSYSIKITNELKVFHPKLRSLFLLLVLNDHKNITSRIWNEDLCDQLVEVVNTRNFYIVSEFHMNETVTDMDIIIGTGENSKNGTIGVVTDPEFTPGRYQIGLALLQTFRDASTISFKASNTFNFPFLGAE